MASRGIRVQLLGERHLPALREMLSDELLQRFTRVPLPVPDGFESSWLAMYEEGRRLGTREAFAIVNDADEFLGLTMLPTYNAETRTAELGYVVAPHARGQGVAQEALRLLTDFAINDLHMQRLELLISVENDASKRVARRCGYSHEGVLRSMEFKQGTREDIEIWSRLAVVPIPAREIEGIRAADAKVLESIRNLDDDAVRRPSRLPGWTVGHVLTHLARNGDSVVRRLQGCASDEIVDQYEGGAEGRADDIEAGASRSATELIADVEATNAAVQAAIAAMPDDAWGRLSRSVGGTLAPAAKVVFSRWREVEVHHVDLGLGYEPDQWPEDLSRRWLADLLPTLPDRTEPQQLLAWMLDRGGPPALGDWE